MSIFCVFVCLVSSHSRFFHFYGDVTITSEWLHSLTYARHSWPLSSGGSLACHTYCDTGHPFTMVIPEDQGHSHLLPSVYQRSGWNSNTQPFAREAKERSCGFKYVVFNGCSNRFSFCFEKNGKINFKDR